MRKTHAPRAWYIAEHPEYRAKIDNLRKMKSKLDKTNEKVISQEKFNLRNARRKKNE
jgi:hypothetical protein